jgi:hypothetical protein
MERKTKLLHEHFVSQRSKDWFDGETFMGLACLRVCNPISKLSACLARRFGPSRRPTRCRSPIPSIAPIRISYGWRCPACGWNGAARTSSLKTIRLRPGLVSSGIILLAGLSVMSCARNNIFHTTSGAAISTLGPAWDETYSIFFKSVRPTGTTGASGTSLSIDPRFANPPIDFTIQEPSASGKGAPWPLPCPYPSE